MRFFRLLPVLAALTALPAAAGPLDFDAGLRASIWNDNYKLGVGGELGLLAGMGKVDLGLHLNYSHFAPKTEGWTAADEFGGYVTLYFLPAINQGFELRLGPHLGASYIEKTFIDAGGDLMAVFEATPKMRFYAAFVPSYFFDIESIGDSEALVRVGFGIELRMGGEPPPAP